MDNKIIFLDIDGVLALCTQEHDDYGATFHKQFVDNLKFIIDNTQAKIVISSTWRSSGLEIMKEMWLKRNLPGEIIGVTPYHETRIRGIEIKEYLSQECNFQRINYDISVFNKYIKDSKCSNYIILDDDSDMLLCQAEHFIKCSCNKDHPDAIEGYGLTKTNAFKAINILNKNIIDLYYKN